MDRPHPSPKLMLFSAALTRRLLPRFGALGILSVTLVPITVARAQETAAGKPRPARVGTDAPRQERNPAQQPPQAYVIRASAADIAAADPSATPAPVPVAVAGVVNNGSGKRKVPKTAAAAAPGAVPQGYRPPRNNVVKKAKPVVREPTAEELTAQRRAESRPTPVGTNAPHYERNADPDARAGRLISIELP